MKQLFNSVLLHSLSLIIVSAVLAGELSKTKIIDDIQHRGSKKVVSELYGDDDEWICLLRNISSGDPGWLDIAVKLKSGADAGASEMLTLSVGEALGNAPEQVLRLSDNIFPLLTICGGPDVDDVRFDSYELSAKEIDKRITKVRSVVSVELEDRTNKCIRYLEASKDKIRSFYKE